MLLLLDEERRIVLTHYLPTYLRTYPTTCLPKESLGMEIAETMPRKTLAVRYLYSTTSTDWQRT